jgi:hypothetical protein
MDFGLLFGVLTATALLLTNWLGFSPSQQFESLKRPHLSRGRLLGAFVRAVLLALAAVLASWIKPVSAQPLDFSLRYGLVVGLVGLPRRNEPIRSCSLPSVENPSSGRNV